MIVYIPIGPFLPVVFRITKASWTDFAFANRARNSANSYSF